MCRKCRPREVLLAEQGGLRHNGEIRQLARKGAVSSPRRSMDTIAELIPIEKLLKRDRWILFAAIAFTTTLAWAYMIHEARGMTRTGVCECMGMQMAGPDTSAWSAPQLFALFLMWSEMMIAMMLPSAAPMILLFASVNRKRREGERPYVSTGIFL